MTTSDAIAIGAAILGSGLTILAVAIAIAAFVGLNGIKKVACEEASKAAHAEILKWVSEKGELGDKLKQEVTRCVAIEANSLYSDMKISGAFPQESTNSPMGNVAEQYPKENKNNDD